MKAVEEDIKQKYTLATRAVDLGALLVTGGFIGCMIVWACLTHDKRFLFIPLLCLVVSFICFVSLLFRFFTEPKIAVQADVNGIYFYYRNNKAIYIDFREIVEIAACRSYNSFGGISIRTQNAKYKSIMIRQDKNRLISDIKNLMNKENKEEYLVKIEIKK